MIKYVRFRDGKELEQDKLIELMDAIQDALQTNAPQTNPSSRQLGPSPQHEPTPVHTIPAATKLEKQNVPSNSGFGAAR